MCELALPNKEISFLYRKEVLDKLEYMMPQSSVISIQEALYSADSELLKKRIETLLMQSASCFDIVGENFYHGFLIGLSATLESYRCDSNKESGNGRYDIQLKSLKENLPGIIIELKAEKNCSEEKLEDLAKTALKQIDDKKYDTELKSAGIHKIIKQLQEQATELIDLASRTEGNLEKYEEEIKKIFSKIKSLRDSLQIAREQSCDSENLSFEVKRIKEIFEKEDLKFHEFDNTIIRRIVECIRVMSDKTIIIILKGGVELKGKIE